MEQNNTEYCSNCTFMELKSVYINSGHYISYGSNCTFMELKLVQTLYWSECHLVLIVPLWN